MTTKIVIRAVVILQISKAIVSQLRIFEPRAPCPLSNKKHLTIFCELTFVTKPRLVFLEALEPDPLAQQVEELIEGGPPLLVVVHILLRLLARPAVHHAHLVCFLIALLVQPDQLLLTGPGLDAEMQTETRNGFNKLYLLTQMLHLR